MPTRRQTATQRNSLAITFGSPVVVGSLLIYAMTRRQSSTPVAPLEETWTTLATCQWQRSDGTDENAGAIYGAIATSARTFYDLSLATNSVMWEVPGGSLVGITALAVSDHATGSAVDLGSFGTVDTGRLMFGLFGNGSNFDSITVTPGVWVRDLFCDRDNNSVGDTLTSAAFPQSYYAHADGAGAAVQASVALSHTEKFGGVAVLLA